MTNRRRMRGVQREGAGGEALRQKKKKKGGRTDEPQGIPVLTPLVYTPWEGKRRGKRRHSKEEGRSQKPVTEISVVSRHW